MTLTNQALFFSQEEGWPLPEKTLEGDHRCCKKALHPKHYAEVLATEGNSWRAAADEEEEEEEQQQEDTVDSGRESGDDKCMVCGEMWTLKTGWHVKCVHSGYILSAYPPIIHTLYHMQTFMAIYSSNFH